VPLNAGINDAVFAHIKTRVNKMKNLEKYCVLMFDEIALEPELQHNQKYDSVDGLVDMGDGERRLALADHALVFLIKGIATAWKMPIAYGFCEGTTTTPDLTRFLKSVILKKISKSYRVNDCCYCMRSGCYQPGNSEWPYA
jgi:hypothetical protein